jgi:hypothetical protein
MQDERVLSERNDIALLSTATSKTPGNVLTIASHDGEMSTTFNPFDRRTMVSALTEVGSIPPLDGTGGTDDEREGQSTVVLSSFDAVNRLSLLIYRNTREGTFTDISSQLQISRTQHPYFLLFLETHLFLLVQLELSSPKLSCAAQTASHCSSALPSVRVLCSSLIEFTCRTIK